MKIELKNWYDVADDLYRYMNPNTKMDTPNSVYETVNKWRYEWLEDDTDLDLYNWCIKNKSKNK